MRIRLMGGLRVEQEGVVVSVRGQCARLLVLLALDQSRHDEAVVELLWPDAPTQVGRARLRNVLSRLNKPIRVVRRDGRILRLRDDAVVDVDWFAHCAEIALQPHAEAVRAEHRAAALKLYEQLLPTDASDDLACLQQRLRRLYLQIAQ